MESCQNIQHVASQALGQWAAVLFLTQFSLLFGYRWDGDNALSFFKVAFNCICLEIVDTVVLIGVFLAQGIFLNVIFFFVFFGRLPNKVHTFFKLSL